MRLINSSPMPNRATQVPDHRLGSMKYVCRRSAKVTSKRKLEFSYSSVSAHTSSACRSRIIAVAYFALVEAAAVDADDECVAMGKTKRAQCHRGV